MNTLRILFALAALLGSAVNSYANFAMSPSGSTTAFAIDAANQGTSLCAAASTECGAVVTIGVDGTPVEGKTSDAAWVSGSGSIVAILKNIANGIASSLPAGNAMVGFVGLQANTTGGCTGFTPIFAAASNNATAIGAAGARTLCGLTLSNTDATHLASIRVYDTGTAPSGGAPCNSGTNLIWAFTQQDNAISPGAEFDFGPFGLAAVSGLVICATGANAANDNTSWAGSVGALVISGRYK